MDSFRELSEVGEVAQTAIGELDEMMPESTSVRGVIVVVEMEYECDSCGDVHEFCYVTSNLDSTAYKRGLLHEALDSVDCVGHASAEPDPYHEDDD